MKKINCIKIFILSLFISLIFLTGADFSKVQAEEAIGDQLTKIEINLWDLNYQNETNEIRLKRIENEVFGTPNTKGTVQERINKLNATLGLESLAEAKTPAFELYKNEDSGINYPVVDMFETQLLGQSYKKENIYKRLERLEGKVFGSTQKGDLAQRTDNLKAKIAVSKPSSVLPSYQTSEYYRSDENEYSFEDRYTEDDIIAKSKSDVQKRNKRRQDNNYSYDYGYGGSDASLQIAGLENSLFGQTYSYDPMTVRLNRLERRIFQRDFASDDEYSRLERLQAASTAKKTTKYYDNNKFQKFAATGMQLGSIVLMILALLL